ncbi:hypothetical protein K501DRAFT_191449 [Backusella circina FSU 941]|nr:hypothetical protein K501DRAFT_191449 [Backusella circina FSU 941]
MCTSLLAILGSPFVLFSFVIELFVLIGQLGNTEVLRSIYFGQTINRSQNLSYSFGLWNYCQGDANGVISECSKIIPAYNWAKAPAIAQVLPDKASSKFTQSLFLGMFILFFIGCGFSLFIWIFSLPFCCARRRSIFFSMTTFVLINFFIMLAALILALVLVLGGIKTLTNADNSWEGHAGNSLWIAIGTVVSLLAAFSIYTCSSYCNGKGRKRVNPKTDVEKTPQYATSPVVVPGQGQQAIVYQQQADGQYLPVAIDPNNPALSPTVVKKGGSTPVNVES